jgi:guanylate kinase
VPDASTVFLAPPSWAELQQRLTDRGTETAEVMARRLATAKAELAAQGEFDVVVVNSQLDTACSELVTLLVGNAPQSA